MTRAKLGQGGVAREFMAVDGDITITPEANDAAARTVCANAESPEDARLLLAMLGITVDGEHIAPPETAQPAPDPDAPTLEDYPSHGIGRRRVTPGTPCAAGCGRQLRPSGTTLEQHPGTHKHVGRGLCRGCRRRIHLLD